MRLDRIKRATFRGASILIPEDTVEGGRNTIEHNYPDSNRRWLEDNGAMVDNYRVQGIVRDSEVGALKAALDRPGVGTLNHPWLGRARVAVMGRYSMVRSDQNLGFFKVDIPFGKTAQTGLTIRVKAIPSTVTSRASDGVYLALEKMGSAWR